MASCPRCGHRFANSMQLGAHIRVCNVIRQPTIPATQIVRPAILQTANPAIPPTLFTLAQRPAMVTRTNELGVTTLSLTPWGVVEGQHQQQHLDGNNSRARDYRELQVCSTSRFVALVRLSVLLSVYVCACSSTCSCTCSSTCAFVRLRALVLVRLRVFLFVYVLLFVYVCSCSSTFSCVCGHLFS